MPNTDDELNKRLAELWPPRDDWEQREWTALYEVVYRVLRRYQPPYYRSLSRAGLKPDTLIADFFAERVFLKTKEKLIKTKGIKENIAEEIKAAFLRQGYKWYLLDQLRALPGQHNDDTNPDDGGGTKDDPDEVEAGVWEILQQYGLNPETVIEQACNFLGARDRWQDIREELWWIRPYLAEHHCPDKERATPLNRLATIYDIPAYDYRARQLGITWSRGGFADIEAFQNTFLGHWIQSLTELDQQTDSKEASKTGASWKSDRAFVSTVLGILCRVALIYQGLISRRKPNDG